jgi:nitroreductase
MTPAPNPNDIPRIKLAPVSSAVHALARGRFSPRSFSKREIAPADLKLMLEAARWAPSCFNEQPWRFIVGANPRTATYAKLLSCLVESNRVWAAGAPVLMLTLGKRTFAHNGKPNRYGLHDAGMALAGLTLQANALGIFVHAMGGFDHQKSREAFAIPEDYDLGAAVAMGYLGDLTGLTEKHLAEEIAPRTRRPIEEIVFEETFGQAAVL